MSAVTPNPSGGSAASVISQPLAFLKSLPKGVVYFLFDECKAIDSTDSPLQVRLTDDQILGLRAACKDFNVPYDAVADGLVLHKWIQPTPLMFFVSLPIPVQNFLSDECGVTDETNAPLHSRLTNTQIAGLAAVCAKAKVDSIGIIDKLDYHGWIKLTPLQFLTSLPKPVQNFLDKELHMTDETKSPLHTPVTDAQLYSVHAVCTDSNVIPASVRTGLLRFGWRQESPLEFFGSLPTSIQDFLSDECGATDDTNTPLHSPVTDAQLASLRALCTASKVNPDTIIDGLLFHGWIVNSKVGGTSSRPRRTRKANRRLARMTRRQ